jgi:hypothetical protein
MARDLIAELRQKRAAAALPSEGADLAVSSGVLKPASKVKAAKATPEPDAGWISAEDTEKVAAEAVHRELDAVFFVCASQAAQDAAVESECEETVKALQMIHSSAFFCTSIAFNGQPLWKTTESNAMAGGPLYIFHVPVKGHESCIGWYCANHLFSSEKEKNKMTDLLTIAWAQGEGPYPNTYHIPYWAKKPIKEVVTTTLWEAYLQTTEQAVMLKTTEMETKGQLETLAVCMDQLIRDETPSDQQKADARSVIDGLELQEQLDAPSSGSKDIDDVEHADDAEQSKGSKGKSKQCGKSKQHGGWMPKLAQLTAAYLNRDWPYCSKLIDRWYSESKTFAFLTDQKLK